MDPLDFVAAQPPFDLLSRPDLDLLGRNLEGVFFPAGTYILREGGQSGSNVFVIRKGSVRLVRDGRELAVLEEGEPFGYPLVRAGNPLSADAIADEDVLAYRIPKQVLDQLSVRNEIEAFFIEGLAERLRRFSDLQAAPLGGDLARPIGSLVARRPLLVDQSVSVSEAAAVMRDERASSVLVSGGPLGIITDRDLRSRVVADGISLDTPVSAVMTSPLKTLTADAPLYAALLFMLEENIHHLPVARDGQVVGVVTDTDLLRHQGKSPLHLLKRVEKIEREEGNFDYGREIAAMADGLLSSDLNAAQIGRVVATLNDTLTVRLLRSVERDLGPPPCRYAWVVFGSEGRREQMLLTDQDNALIFARDGESDRSYFAELARRVVDGLVAAGFPVCRGGFTADRLLWSFEECRSLFTGWMAEPRPEAVLNAGVLFDFRSVHETMSLEPLVEIVIEARDNDLFMAYLARDALRFEPPLTLFRGIKGERIDIKMGGISPAVNLARLYGMLGGSRARSTEERLGAAAHAGVLSEESAETLAEVFRFMLRLRLERQLASLRTGDAPGNWISIKSLSALERRHLVEGLRFVRGLQHATAQRFESMRLR